MLLFAYDVCKIEYLICLEKILPWYSCMLPLQSVCNYCANTLRVYDVGLQKEFSCHSVVASGWSRTRNTAPCSRWFPFQLDHTSAKLVVIVVLDDGTIANNWKFVSAPTAAPPLPLSTLYIKLPAQERRRLISSGSVLKRIYRTSTKAA